MRDDPEYFANIVGGAKKHGEVNYTLEANVPYTIVDKDHPIMKGMSDFKITDEAFFLMTWSKTPEVHVLATAVIDGTPSAGTHKGEVVPQIWTYEKSLAPAPTGSPYRAFVWMQGHNYSNFALPAVQAMMLRAIAWVGKRPVDTLMTERPQRKAAAAAAGARTGAGSSGGSARGWTRAASGERSTEVGTVGQSSESSVVQALGVGSRQSGGDCKADSCEPSSRPSRVIGANRKDQSWQIRRSGISDRRRGSASSTRTASSIAAGSAAGCPKASSTAGRSSGSATRGRS